MIWSESGFGRVVGDVLDDAGEFRFTSYDVIVGLILPKGALSILKSIDGLGGEAFPAVENIGKLDLVGKNNQEVHMIRHDDEVPEMVAVTIEML